MRLEIRNAEIVARELRDVWRQYPEIARDETRAALSLIVARMESEVMQRTPVGVGGSAGLRGSIFGEIRGDNKSIRGIWGTPLGYGEVIEFGRKPGGLFPPIGPLEIWVRRKLGLTENTVGVAMAISRAIQRRGYSPNGDVGPDGARMFEEAWEATEDWASVMLGQLPARIVNRAGGE